MICSNSCHVLILTCFDSVESRRVGVLCFALAMFMPTCPALLCLILPCLILPCLTLHHVGLAYYALPCQIQ